MKIRSLSLGMALALLVCLVAAPQPAEAQCNVTNTTNSTFFSTVIVQKTLSMSAFCSLTMFNNALCGPGTMGNSTSFLVASNMALLNPSCQWNCACGTVRIDGSDGLPVELLDFSIEEDEAEENAVAETEEAPEAEKAPE